MRKSASVPHYSCSDSGHTNLCFERRPSGAKCSSKTRTEQRSSGARRASGMRALTEWSGYHGKRRTCEPVCRGAGLWWGRWRVWNGKARVDVARERERARRGVARGLLWHERSWRHRSARQLFPMIGASARALDATPLIRTSRETAHKKSREYTQKRPEVIVRGSTNNGRPPHWARRQIKARLHPAELGCETTPSPQEPETRAAAHLRALCPIGHEEVLALTTGIHAQAALASPLGAHPPSQHAVVGR